MILNFDKLHSTISLQNRLSRQAAIVLVGDGLFALPQMLFGGKMAPMLDLAQIYADASDDEIARLHGQIESLTNQARTALHAEIQRRGYSSEDMEKQREQLDQDTRDLVEAQMRRRPWARMFLQVLVVLVTAGAYLAIGGFFNVGGSSGAFGGALGNATILAWGIGLFFLRGRILRTLVVAVILFSAVTIVIAIFH